MKINANSIRAGNVLEHNGRLCVVSKTPYITKPNKNASLTVLRGFIIKYFNPYIKNI